MNNKTRSSIQFKRMLSLLMTFFVLALVALVALVALAVLALQHPQRAMDSMLMEHPSMMQTATYLRCVV